MSAKIDEAENEPDKFASMVLHYSENAEKYLKANDFHKASEMIYGAMSSVLKAVAAKKNLYFESHKELAGFARTLAKMEKDEEILNSFSHASLLHKNFYESNLNELEVRTLIEKVRKTIGKLMKKMSYRAP